MIQLFFCFLKLQQLIRTCFLKIKFKFEKALQLKFWTFYEPQKKKLNKMLCFVVFVVLQLLQLIFSSTTDVKYLKFYKKL